MFETIVCASGGSPDSDRALACARRLAEQYDASLRVVHVAEHPNTWQAGSQEDLAIARLRGQVSALRRHGVDASLHVVRSRDDRVAHHIANTAAAVHADLVVIATRGRSPLAGPLGSVTARLIRIADCPILAVPPAAERPAQSAPTAATGESVPAAAA